MQHHFLLGWLVALGVLNSAQALDVPLTLKSKPAISGTVSGSLFPWKASCQPLSEDQVSDCGIPQAISEKGLLVKIPLAEVFSPGQADAVTKDFQIKNGEQNVAKGRLTLYSVYPHAESGFPPYLQVRLELVSPVRAVCTESVKWRGTQDLPPVICAGFEQQAGGITQYGVTLKFGAVKP